jgi:hypothetical protein
VLQKIFRQFVPISLAIIVASCASNSTQPTENPARSDDSDTVEADIGTRPSAGSEPTTTGNSAIDSNSPAPSSETETSGSDDTNADESEPVTTVTAPGSKAEAGTPSTSTIPTTTLTPNSTVPTDFYTEEPTDPFITYEPQT